MDLPPDLHNQWDRDRIGSTLFQWVAGFLEDIRFQLRYVFIYRNNQRIS